MKHTLKYRSRPTDLTEEQAAFIAALSEVVAAPAESAGLSPTQLTFSVRFCTGREACFSLSTPEADALLGRLKGNLPPRGDAFSDLERLVAGDRWQCGKCGNWNLPRASCVGPSSSADEVCGEVRPPPVERHRNPMRYRCPTCKNTNHFDTVCQGELDDGYGQCGYRPPLPEGA